MAGWRLALANGAVLLGVIGVMTVGTETAATPLLASHTEALDGLETAASQAPTEDNVGALAEAYLAHRQPGLASAVLNRAPEEVAQLPRIRMLNARSHFGMGEALVAERMLMALQRDCDHDGCSRVTSAQTAHYLGLVREVVDAGISDPDVDRGATKAAFARGSRTVRLVAMRN